MLKYPTEVTFFVAPQWLQEAKRTPAARLPILSVLAEKVSGKLNEYRSFEAKGGRQSTYTSLFAALQELPVG